MVKTCQANNRIIHPLKLCNLAKNYLQSQIANAYIFSPYQSTLGIFGKFQNMVRGQTFLGQKGIYKLCICR